MDVEVLPKLSLRESKLELEMVEDRRVSKL